MKFKKGDLVVINNPVDNFFLTSSAMEYHGQLGIVEGYWGFADRVRVYTTDIDCGVLHFSPFIFSTKYLELIEPNFE